MKKTLSKLNSYFMREKEQVIGKDLPSHNVVKIVNRYKSLLKIPESKEISYSKLLKTILSQMDDARKRQHYGHIRNFFIDLSILYEYKKENETALITLMKAMYIDDSGIHKNAWVIDHPELKEHINIEKGELLEVFKADILRIAKKINLDNSQIINLYSKILKKEALNYPLSLITHEKAMDNFKNFIN